jgi:hypothetical protein
MGRRTGSDGSFYVESGSASNGRPSVEINRRTGDSVDAFDADSVDCEDISGDTPLHMFAQSSMGKGASNIDGGISALNCSSAALVLNSGHPYSDMQWPQRLETTARFLKQQRATTGAVSGIQPLS